MPLFQQGVTGPAGPAGSGGTGSAGGITGIAVQDSAVTLGIFNIINFDGSGVTAVSTGGTAYVLVNSATGPAGVQGPTGAQGIQGATGTVLGPGAPSGSIQFNNGSVLQGASGVFPTTNAIAFGSPAAATGSIRVPNAIITVAARNAANTADFAVLGTDSTNRAYLGNSAGDFLRVTPGGGDGGLTITGQFVYQAGTSQPHIFNGGGTAYTQIDQTGITLKNNNTYIKATDISSTARNIIGIDGSNYLTLANFAQSLVSGDDIIIYNAFGQLMRGGCNAGNPLNITDGGTGLTTGVFSVNKVLNSAISFSSTTLASSNLSFTAQANEVWDVAWEGWFSTGSGSAAGINFACSAPSGSVLNGYIYGTATSATTFTSQAINSTGATIALGTGLSINGIFRFTMTVALGVTAGTIVLQYARGTGTSVTQTIQPGAKLFARRTTAV